MGSRRRARELALQALYEREFRPRPEENIVDELAARSKAHGDDKEYAMTLMKGIGQHRADIDRWVSESLENWAPERLTLMDRNILRIGVFELKYCPDVPPKSAIDEAIEVARKFGGEDSPRFVNGVLDRVMRLGPAPCE